MPDLTRRSLLASGAASVAALGVAGSEAPLLRKWPKPLLPGDTVALVAPASPTEQKDVDDVVARLAALGLKSKPMPHLLDKVGLFAGLDADRAADINLAIGAPSIQAIACVRGGWGCARILPLIDWGLLRANPKPIVGFSDVSSLLVAAWAKAGVVTYHGMWAPRMDDPFTVGAWKKALMTADSFDLFEFGDSSREINTLTASATPIIGTLIGGNLTVLNQLVGTGYLPNFDGAIAFFEDLNEPPYRLDRMLTQLRLAGQFQRVRGIVLGQFLKCDDAELNLKGADILRDFFAGLKIPTVTNAPFGHIRHQVIVPIGAEAEFVTTGRPAVIISRS